jgi:hypothetical protein
MIGVHVDAGHVRIHSGQVGVQPGCVHITYIMMSAAQDREQKQSAPEHSGEDV